VSIPVFQFRRSYRNVRPVPGDFLLVLLSVILSGCATPQTDRMIKSTALPRSMVELNAVPFFPQETHQCGPAALATILDSSGLNVTPEELASQVYIPGRQGSLQFELLAAARRNGRVPYVLQPQLEALLTEIASGNPVLVLQNLGISIVPLWHYAVVVGFDLDSAEVILRSGRERRHITPMRTFERTWRRSNYWAVVVLPPNRLPQTAQELPYLHSVLALESLKRWQDTSTAYTTALQRWPKSLGAQMGLGNSRYALGDIHGAEEVFRAATREHPQAGVAFNNLAQVLVDQGRLVEAETLVRRAVELGGDNVDIFQQTLTYIEWRAKSE
jgi:tetratricopeptide (TPR) repeat protein